MIYEHTNYRSYLRSILAKRISANSAYSSRALARNLGLAASTLSEVLKGEKNLSPEKAMAVAHRLELSPGESDYFCLLVQYASAKRPDHRELLLAKIQKTNPQAGFNDLS